MWPTSIVASYELLPNRTDSITPNKTIPGLVVDCLPILTVFASTLECFYDQSCVDLLLSVYPGHINISILNSSRNSGFVPKTPIKDLVDVLFIEGIIKETSFRAYYEECKPIQCTYTYQRRFDWIYIITTITALIGGLNVGFRLIAPILLDLGFWLKRKVIRRNTDQQQNQHHTSDSMTTLNKLKFITQKYFKSVKEFNLFSDNHSQDIFLIIRGRITTRLYVLSLMGAMYVLTIYTSQSVQTINRTLKLPSQGQYESLYEKYRDSLQCPCTTLSIPYGDLMSITPTFHQLCASAFVREWWYESLLYHWSLTQTYDFRLISSSYFRTLAMFCEIANLTITTAYHHFSTTIYVNAEVIPRSIFISQTDSFIRTFQNLTRLDFLYEMTLVKELLHTDQYVSGLETNGAMLIVDATEEALVNNRPFHVTPITWGNEQEGQNACFCAIDATCAVGEVRGVMFTIPSIHIACSMLETAMQSDLSCWYDTECIDYLRTGFYPLGWNLSYDATALSTSLPSKFRPDTLLQDVVDAMMVENYNATASFDAFYEKCRPSSCSYTYKERSSLLYMITTMIGLFGGLNIVLRLISRIVVKAVYRRANTQQQAISSITNTEDQSNEG